MLKRVLIGAGLMGLIVLAVFSSPLFLAGLVLLWIFLSSREFVFLLNRQGVGLAWSLISSLNLIVPIALLLSVSVLGRMSCEFRFEIVFVPLLLLSVWVLFVSAPRGVRLAYGSLGIIWLSVLPTHLLLLKYRTLETQGFTSWVVMYPLLVTWLNDTAALLVGKTMGRHRLSSISPSKTWEGFVGGLVISAMGSGLFLPRVLPQVSPAPAAVLGLVLGIAAQVGDLMESIFKREAAVKDSSSILSEHGGFLDRADSLLFTIPVAYYLLSWFVR